MKCTKRRKDGEACGGAAVDGTVACTKHGGRSVAEQKARGAVVVAVRRWGLDDRPEDPASLLLRLMTVTEWNRQAYEAEIDRCITESGSRRLSDALIGDTIVVDKDGSPHTVGEYIRGIVQLEGQERDRAASFATKALAAGIAERQVALAERQGQLVADVIRAVLGDLGHDVTDPAVTRVVSTRLRLLAGGC